MNTFYLIWSIFVYLVCFCADIVDFFVKYAYSSSLFQTNFINLAKFLAYLQSPFLRPKANPITNICPNLTPNSDRVLRLVLFPTFAPITHLTLVQIDS